MMPPTSPSVYPNFVAYDTHELTEHFKVASQDGVTTVTMDRPPANAVNHDVITEIRQTAIAIDADPDVRVVVLRSAVPRMFMAGADLVGMVDTGWAQLAQTISDFQTSVNRWEAIKAPTIAVIEGWAMGGGCELALACDFRIMAEEATIGVPEIKIGILPGAGGTQRLSHMLPPAIAKQMIYLGDPLTSQKALQYGLVNDVVPAARVLEVALDLARRLMKMPPLAVRSGKLLVHAGMNSDLKTGIEAERHALAFLFGTEDRAEGMGAFLQKREAAFKGR